MGDEVMWETTIDLDTACGYLEGIPATFKLAVDNYPTEPGPSGVSTTIEYEVTAYLEYVTLGELLLSKKDVIFATSYPQVETIEKDYAEKYYEEVIKGA